MNKTNVCKAVVFGLIVGSAGAAQAQVRESIGAEVPSQSGAPSPYATPVRAPSGTILADEFSGRFITNPTGGFGGAPASAIQPPQTTFGFGSQIGSNNWVAEDFTVPAQGWSITQARFYTYQTGSTTTSTINDARVQIFSGTPTGAPVFGDTATNRLSSTSFTSVYRVPSDALTDPNRPVMEVVVNFSPPLELTTPGTYWIAWSLGGTLASGPWTPPQTLVGVLDTGNCQQSLAGAAFAPILEAGSASSNGCPFTLEGATLPVQLQQFKID